MSHGEVAFAIELIELSIELFELVFEEGDVQSLEFLEDFVREDEVEAIDLGAAAADVDRDEVFELLQDTVTKREAELLNDEVVELFELAHHGLGDGVLLLGLVEELG